MIRAVIDTNIIVSAMISPSGNEALLILAINRGLVIPCFSTEILREYSDVLLRPKFGFVLDEVDSLLELFRQRGTPVDTRPISQRSPDPGDDKFIACAIAGKAGFLVTDNKRHFPPNQLPGCKVVSAREFMAFITVDL